MFPCQGEFEGVAEPSAESDAEDGYGYAAALLFAGEAAVYEKIARIEEFGTFHYFKVVVDACFLL